MIWRHFLYNFMVLRNGPVQNTLCFAKWLHGTRGVGKLGAYAPRNLAQVSKGRDSRLKMCEAQNTIARKCRFPKLWNSWCTARWKQRTTAPCTGTLGSHRLALLVHSTLGTMGYHCKQLPVPRGWTLLVPNLGTMGYHCKQLPVTSTLALMVAIRGNHRLPWHRNCRFPDVETYATATLGTRGYHCKELPVLCRLALMFRS